MNAYTQSGSGEGTEPGHILQTPGVSPVLKQPQVSTLLHGTSTLQQTPQPV